LIAERLVDILQPDVCAAGGISECKKIADMANAFGVRVNPHVWGTAVGLAASLQLIAALPHNPPGLHPIDAADGGGGRADRAARRLGRGAARPGARHRDRPRRPRPLRGVGWRSIRPDKFSSAEQRPGEKPSPSMAGLSHVADEVEEKGVIPSSA
jgi:hypothetical protein